MTLSVLLAHAAAGPTVAISGYMLLACLSFLIALTLLKTYDHSFGALLNALADAVEDIWVVGGSLAGAVRWINGKVLAGLSAWVGGSERAAAAGLDALAWVVRETGSALEDFAEDVRDGWRALVEGGIPSAIEDRTRPLTDRLSKTNQGLIARDRVEAQARARGIDRLGRDLTREKLSRERGIDYIAGRLRGLEGVIAGRIAAEVGALRGWVTRGFGRRLTRVEQLVLGSALTAASLATLTRYFPYWRCTNVRRFNRALCRSPISDWAALLGLFSFVVVALDPERMAQLAEDLTDELGGLIEQMAG